MSVGGLRVVVTGGRDFDDKAWVWSVLDRLHHERGIARLAHGGASGADIFAAQWAGNRGVHGAPYPADWRVKGKKAGPLRNREMLDAEKPDGVIAFPGGRGTADCCRAAAERGIPVWCPKPPR